MVRNGSQSKLAFATALGSQKDTVSFGYVMHPRPLSPISKGGRRTRPTDAHRPVCLACVLLRWEVLALLALLHGICNGVFRTGASAAIDISSAMFSIVK